MYIDDIFIAARSSKTLRWWTTSLQSILMCAPQMLRNHVFHQLSVFEHPCSNENVINLKYYVYVRVCYECVIHLSLGALSKDSAHRARVVQ
jgi:hypothetical protein